MLNRSRSEQRPSRLPLDVLRCYVRRWFVEVTFAEVRRHLGVETQRQRSDKAIARNPEGWFVAGRRPAVQDGKAAFWLNLKITAGTNVKADTAAFVRAAFEGMRALLGPLHEES